MVKQVTRLIKIWLHLAFLAGQTQLLTNWSGLLFITGKLVRFIFYFVFLISIIGGVKELVGYSRNEVIFVFLIFTLVDTLAQFLFRGVYVFRYSVINGNFDMDLLKPIPSLFRPVFGWTDILDGLTLIPLVTYLGYFIITATSMSGLISLIIFLLLILNSMLVAFALHLFFCSICVITLEVDYLTWVYRDVTALGRFPTDIYPKGVRFILTFIIPVIVLFAIPAKLVLGRISTLQSLPFLLVGPITVFLSLRFWQYALKKYSSASS